VSRGRDQVRTSWEGVVNDVPPTANNLLRMHFRVRKELKNRWYLEIYAAFARDGVDRMPTVAAAKRRVTVTVRSKQERDDANQWAGVDKLIFDNLVALRWLANDSPKWIEPHIHGEVGQPRTVIRIEEIL
jgi:hypothetical protein